MSSGEERIAGGFRAARDAGRRAALMPYLMGGFPDVDTSRRIGEACADNGADLLELGIPYSDPLADGPVIHEAGTQALRAGATTEAVLGVAEALAQRIPVVVMCYANLVLARGAGSFCAALAGRGVAGLIVPDLPLGEGEEIRDACEESGLALVPLIAPTTPDERLAAIGERARGFLYTVSVTGTTGERAGPAGGLDAVVRRAKACTHVPVAVGFGISSPQDAAATADAGADGVIVGSRLVREAATAVESGEDPAAAVGKAVGALSAGLEG